MEIRTGYSTTAECMRRLARELNRPIYCDEVKHYIQYRLETIEDDTEDDRNAALWRSWECALELSGMEPETLRPEQDPEYPKLVSLWEEVKTYKRQAFSTRTSLDEEQIRHLGSLEVEMRNELKRHPFMRDMWIYRLTHEFICPYVSEEVQSCVNLSAVITMGRAMFMMSKSK